MSVRVRLTRVGSKKNPIWRVVVADQRSPRDGRFIETIGRYNPQTNPSTIAIDEERLEHWIARGAQPTGVVKQLMKAQAKSGGPQQTEVQAAAAAAAEPGPPAEPESPDAAESGSAAAPESAPAAETEATATAPADDGEGEPSPTATDS
jgi:small subunit ribosomal protein S16